MKLLLELSVNDLKRAAAIKEKMNRLGKQLVAILGGYVSTSSEAPATQKRSKMSASARAKIAAAQKARWAKSKGTGTFKKKSGMSAAGRARVAAAQKARWAKVKSAKAGK